MFQFSRENCQDADSYSWKSKDSDEIKMWNVQKIHEFSLSRSTRAYRRDVSLWLSGIHWLKWQFYVFNFLLIHSQWIIGFKIKAWNSSAKGRCGNKTNWGQSIDLCRFLLFLVIFSQFFDFYCLAISQMNAHVWCVCVCASIIGQRSFDLWCYESYRCNNGWH